MREAMMARSLARGGVVLLVLVCGSPASGGDGAVALNTCDMSCPDDSNAIYVACGNGTVTDNRTGLVWLANADCFGQLSWDEAMAVVAGLGDLPESACAGLEPDECDCGLSDHSSPGEWRLPSMAEWKAVLVTGTDVDECQPAILNDMGSGCWDDYCVEMAACSFYGVQAATYWASSSFVSEPTYAWVAELGQGGMSLMAREDGARIWAVRGGQ